MMFQNGIQLKQRVCRIHGASYADSLSLLSFAAFAAVEELHVVDLCVDRDRFGLDAVLSSPYGSDGLLAGCRVSAQLAVPT